jgi:hypothetical protein
MADHAHSRTWLKNLGELELVLDLTETCNLSCLLDEVGVVRSVDADHPDMRCGEDNFEGATAGLGIGIGREAQGSPIRFVAVTRLDAAKDIRLSGEARGIGGT